MYKLAETYMELIRDDFVSLIRIYKRFKHLGMKKHNMFKVLELANQSFRTPARKGRKP